MGSQDEERSSRVDEQIDIMQQPSSNCDAIIFHASSNNISTENQHHCLPETVSVQHLQMKSNQCNSWATRFHQKSCECPLRGSRSLIRTMLDHSKADLEINLIGEITGTKDQGSFIMLSIMISSEGW